MKISVTVPSFRDWVNGTTIRAAEAVTAGVKAATDGAKIEMRQALSRAGLGNRLPNAIGSEVWPKGRPSLKATGSLFARGASADAILSVFARGATIRARAKKYLMIPTDAARRSGIVGKLEASSWRMPPGAVYVGRPTRWGNPFPWSGAWIVWAAVARGFRADAAGRRAAAVAIYREWMTDERAAGPHAGEKSGDRIEYTSGVALSTAEAARGMAAGMAMISSAGIAVPKPPAIAEIRAALRGHDLACFGPLAQPCHADVLLELANR